VVVGERDMEERMVEEDGVKKNIVLREHDNIVFFI
jgi:hypothetical protein